MSVELATCDYFRFFFVGFLINEAMFLVERDKKMKIITSQHKYNSLFKGVKHLTVTKAS